MNTPLKPTGFDPESTFHQDVHESSFGPAKRLCSSSTVRVDRTPRGIFLHAKPGKSSPTPQGVTYQVFHFKQSLGDYILTTENTPIAKPAAIRNSITAKNIYGVNFGYSYPHNPAGGGPSTDPLAYLYRVSSLPGTADVERQGLTPDYAVNDLIEAIQVDADQLALMTDPLDLVSSPKGVAQSITWVQLRDAYWTRFADQGFGI